MPVLTLLFVGTIVFLMSAFVLMFQELERHAQTFRSRLAMVRATRPGDRRDFAARDGRD